MTEQDTTLAGTPEQRVQIAASPDWQNLLNYFDLAGDGFAFIVLVVPDGEWAAACHQALERYLMAYKKKIAALDFKDAEEFREKMPSQLLSLRAGEDTGAVWVEAAVPEVSKEYGAWHEAWRIAAARLNQYRNPLREQLNVPLLFVGAPWFQATLRETAPDLWSVRTLVIRIEPSAIDESKVTRFSPTGPYETELSIGRSLDPDFALKEAERLRGQPSKEIALADLLYRAGLGFIARYRWDEAERTLTEAVNLYHSYGGEPETIGQTLSTLADVLLWKNKFEQADTCLLEALRLFQQSGNVLGEANCFDQLGYIAYRHSQFDEAKTRYEQALQLYRQISSVLGEVNSLFRLGDIARIQTMYSEAQRYFEQSLSLYQKLEDTLGQANSMAKLGQLAIEKSEYDEARSRLEAALSLYRSISNVLGEANSIQDLGYIAYRHSQFDEAKTRYEQALQLYRQIGDVIGEANSKQRLGELAEAQGEVETAKQFYDSALKLYEQVRTPYASGWTYRYLARLAENETERQRYIKAAKDAWESIGLTDLIEDMNEEFSAPN